MNKKFVLTFKLILIFILSDAIDCKSLGIELNDAYLINYENYQLLTKQGGDPENDGEVEKAKEDCPYTCIFSARKNVNKSKPKSEYVKNLPRAHSFLRHRNSQINVVHLTRDNLNGKNFIRFFWLVFSIELLETGWRGG